MNTYISIYRTDAQKQDNKHVQLTTIREEYKDHILELKLVINGIVQLSGYANSSDTILTVQYDSAHFRNHGLVSKVAPHFYMKDEDPYQHYINIADIPKPLKIYVANWRTDKTSKLIYEDKEDF